MCISKSSKLLFYTFKNVQGVLTALGFKEDIIVLYISLTQS